MSTKIIDIDAYEIRKLQTYYVKIEYDPSVKENRGDVFTTSTIYGQSKKCVRL